MKPFSATSAAYEIDRYISMPGQGCAYKVGEITIWNLRRRAEKALGPKFDLKRFHKAILSCGFVPLTALETIVDIFIRKMQE